MDYGELVIMDLFKMMGLNINEEDLNTIVSKIPDVITRFESMELKINAIHDSTIRIEEHFERMETLIRREVLKCLKK